MDEHEEKEDLCIIFFELVFLPQHSRSTCGIDLRISSPIRLLLNLTIYTRFAVVITSVVSTIYSPITTKARAQRETMLLASQDVVYVDSDEEIGQVHLQSQNTLPLLKGGPNLPNGRSEEFAAFNGISDPSAPQTWALEDLDNSVSSYRTPEPAVQDQASLYSTNNHNGGIQQLESPKESSVVIVDLSDEDVDDVDQDLIIDSAPGPDLSSYSNFDRGGSASSPVAPNPQTTLPDPNYSQVQVQDSRDSSKDMDYESGSDDEIAVLSKEEAERTGTFKPTSFEINSRYNQPVPVVHAGGLSEAELLQRQEDAKVREYFERYSFPQIEQHEQNLNNQLQQLDQQRDGFLKKISDLRAQILNLMFDQVSLRGEIMRTINETLRDAEATIKRSKKVRRFHAILKSVKEFKLNPFSMNVPPNMAHFNPNSAQSYGSYVNPYMAAQPAQVEDSVHLQQLLNDIYKEETVEGMASTPESLTVQLLDHQRKGLHWLLRREESLAGSLLADDMGLGKTVQTIALIMANRSSDSSCKTTLIVSPVSLLRQWDAEIKAKVTAESALKVGFFHGPDRKRLSNFKSLAKFDVVLTSYTTLASEYKQHYASVIESAQVTPGQNLLPDEDSGGQTYLSPFYSPGTNFYRIVLDEAQYIKNKLSQTSKATALLKGKHRLCLTGTPMQNSIDELYPIIRFLRVKPYDDEKKFKRDIAVPIKSKSDSTSDYNDERMVSMRKLRAVLLAIMLRRTKDLKIDGKPLIQLPEKKVDLVYVTMGEEETKFYKELESGIQKRAERLLNLDSMARHSDILTLLLRLRQACIHEYLVLVGEMNAQEKSGGSGNVSDWKQRYRIVSRMSDDLRQRVDWGVGKGLKVQGDMREEDNSDEANEIQFTCPLCFDVVGEESIVIFGSCGHTICEGCVGSFFEQFKTESSEYGNREASCNVCSMKVTNGSLVDYDFYLKMVNDHLSYSQLEDFYGSHRRAKLLNGDKVARIIDEHKGFKQSAKMTKTLDIIQQVTEDSPDDKIIIFSHFTTTFDMMAHALRQKNIQFLRYDGSMNIDLKNSTISEFYQGQKRVLLISLKAGNVGLTLTCASHVIIMDPFWNPFVEEQAMDRAHRFGQMKPVKVYKLLIHDSVEDRIMDLQVRKKELIGSALDESALKQSSHLGRRELGYLFGLNSLDRAI